MNEIQSLTELVGQADRELLKQLIHWLADKDSRVNQECLDFLKPKVTHPSQAIIKYYTEEIWSLWNELESDLLDLDECDYECDENGFYVADCLSKITEILKENEIPKKERLALIEEVLPYINSGIGMDACLYDVAYAACKSDEDWKFLAESFEQIGNDCSLDRAREIYRKIGSNAKFLELRTMKMISGLDYYDLVSFYVEQGDMERAVAMALEGMAKAAGRKNELCEFMVKHFSKEDNPFEYLKAMY